MPEQPLLHDRQVDVDRGRVGISYSGAGPLLPVELGVAQAFVDVGIRPFAIAGVSAGAITAVVHAIDPVGGAGIQIAARELGQVNNRSLGLSVLGVLWRLIRERTHIMGLGSNESIQGLAAAGFRQLTGRDRLTVDYFGRDGRPQLLISATDRLTGDSVLFPGDADVADALIASSAIVGIFEPKRMTVGGVSRLLVDGGVVDNQPLSVLALAGCGTLYACAVGYDGGALAAPSNLLDNAMKAFAISQHAASRLEQDFVQLRMGDAGVIHHVHPPVQELPVAGFDFSPALVARLMRDARDLTVQWLTEYGLTPGGMEHSGP